LLNLNFKMKTIHNKKGQFIKVIWNKADKKKHSERMSGKNNYFYGKHHTKADKKIMSKIKKILWKSIDRLNVICKHHLDLNKKNNKKYNILILTNSKHSKFHRQSYRFLVEYGLIKKYIKWFDKKYGLK